ncbi:MAG: tyrosine-type recombinase/integrase [Rubrimonas sp.]
MPRHRLSLPPAMWPPEVRVRFDALVRDKHQDQRRRLFQGLGRWLKLARDEGVAPEAVDAAIWARRAAGLGPDARRAMRQAVGLVWPVSLDVTQALRTGERLRKAPDARAHRRRAIERLLHRLPEPWRGAATPLVRMGATSLEDGPLHDVWRPGALIRRLDALARHLELCSRIGRPPQVTPTSVRAMLTDATAERRIERTDGKRLPPMRPGAIAAEITALLGAVRAIMPARDWSWLATAEKAITKRAAAHGSRNEGRIVDVADLRRAGLEWLMQARAAHDAAPGLRDRIRAHDRARAGLVMVMLSESPLRIGSVARLDLQESLTSDLRRVIIAREHTKEKMEDVRPLSADLVAAITQYVAVHRPVLAQPGETGLIVDRWGKRITTEALSTAFGKATRKVFGRAVNPHAIRTSVATWIVATAPAEAALASLILHHRSLRTTNAYQAAADQIAASGVLHAAASATAARVLKPPAPSSRRGAAPRPARSLRLELANRRHR